jgi:hypothetical protein
MMMNVDYRQKGSMLNNTCTARLQSTLLKERKKMIGTLKDKQINGQK